MRHENLGGNKPKPLTTRESTGRRGRRDDRGASNSATTSSEKRPRSNASAQTGGRSGPRSRPVETRGLETPNADGPELIADGGHPRERAVCREDDCKWTAEGPPWEVQPEIVDHARETSHEIGVSVIDTDPGDDGGDHAPVMTDGGRDRDGRCPNCERLLVYNGECAGCDWTADEHELATDGGAKYHRGPEAKSARQLRIAIGAKYGRDLRERVDSIGNSPAAVAFRRPLLEEIAADVLDDATVEDLSVKQLRAMVARALDHEPPAGHFTWLHLRDIYETIVDPEDITDYEQLDVDDESDGPDQRSRTIAGPGDDGCHDVNWGREK
jgi:hypothetical protein